MKKTKFFQRFSKSFKASVSDKLPNDPDDETPDPSGGDSSTVVPTLSSNNSTVNPSTEAVVQSVLSTTDESGVLMHTSEPSMPEDQGVPSLKLDSQYGKYFTETSFTPDDGKRQHKTSRALLELRVVLAEFKRNYEQFAFKNSHYVLIEDDFERVFESVESSENNRQIAKSFGDKVQTVLQVVERKKNLTAGKWTTKLGNFLRNLYPIMRFSCGLVAAIADVYILYFLLTFKGILFFSSQRGGCWIRYYFTSISS
jgi:hypothetical protein